MAQIIQLRRGTLSELNSVTLSNGELGVVSSSVGEMAELTGGADLDLAVVPLKQAGLSLSFSQFVNSVKS